MYVSNTIVQGLSNTNVQVVKQLESISIPDMIVNLIPVNNAKAELDGDILSL